MGVGVGVGKGVGVGSGVGDGVAERVGCGDADGETSAWLAPGFETGFVLGPTAPAANAPNPIPATPANASDQRRMDLPERVRAAKLSLEVPPIRGTQGRVPSDRGRIADVRNLHVAAIGCPS